MGQHEPHYSSFESSNDNYRQPTYCAQRERLRTRMMGSRLMVVLLLAALLTLLSLPSAAASKCTTTAIKQEPGSTKKYTICVDGKAQRSYLLFLPKNYEESKTSRSLIISYHGGGRNAQRQLDLDLLTDPYFNKDAIVVYPQGKNDTWEGVPTVPPTDVDFTTNLLTQLTTSLRIDKNRIYATGKSDGGGFIGVLACDATASKLFAAFAPVSGAFYTTTPASECKPETVAIVCNPGRKSLPFAEFHGGVDDTIPYEGGKRRDVCLPSVPHYVTEWAVRNDLGSVNVTTNYTSDTQLASFGADGLVRGYYDRNIGHDWPATIKNADNERQGHKPASYNASEVIVAFFSKYKLP